jgi:hypothetical protein
MVKLRSKGKTNMLKIRISKFFIIVFLLVPTLSLSMFKTSECVGTSFQGKFDVQKGPFGILPLSMSIKKNRCIIDIEKKFIFTSSWQVDLCREPVHIKQKTWTGDSFELRKNYPCKDNMAYCQLIDDLIVSIENDALIYAKGERETLSSDHGKFYCTYLLIKNYLRDAKVFSLTVPSSINIFEKTPLENLGVQEQQAEQLQPLATTVPTEESVHEGTAPSPKETKPISF